MTELTLFASSFDPLSTVTTTGTSCSRCSRFWAVTTSSLTALALAAEVEAGACAQAEPAAQISARTEAAAKTLLDCSM